jgi:GTP-binding protein EngB required for normal cell division
LVDCPGYGGALGNQKEVMSWDKLLGLYILKSPFLLRTLCLIDGRKGAKETDI